MYRMDAQEEVKLRVMYMYRMGALRAQEAPPQ
jgi:hypothetical protein